MINIERCKSEPNSVVLRHPIVGLVHPSNFRPSPNINSSKFSEYLLNNSASYSSNPFYGNKPCRANFYVVITCSVSNVHRYLKTL